MRIEAVTQKEIHDIHKKYDLYSNFDGTFYSKDGRYEGYKTCDGNHFSFIFTKFPS